MALSEENLGSREQPDGLVSESVQLPEDSEAQLEVLLDLLMELNIIDSDEKPVAETLSSQNDSNGKVAEAEPLANVTPQPPLLENLPEMSGLHQPDVADLNGSIEDLKSWLLLPASKPEAPAQPEPENLESNHEDKNVAEFSTPAQADIADLNATIEGLKSWLLPSVGQKEPTKSAAPTEPDILDLDANQEDDNPAESSVPVSPNFAALDATLEKWRNRLDQRQQLEHTPEESLPAQESEEPVNPVESLQNLLFGSQLTEIEDFKKLLTESELPGVHNQLSKIKDKLENIEHQLYDPEQLMKLLLPWIAHILSLKISDSKEEVIQAIVPIIDEVIKNRTQQNKLAMSAAIADLLPGAISQQIKNSPEEMANAIAPEIAIAIKQQIRLDRDAIAEALAPEMGRAIKEQIRLERDVMVDALYPVIGNTITRYLGEAIRSINEKVSNSFSVEGVQRKIRAKVQGVSEAELILREALPFSVPAIFLIHKTSGLIISDVQHSGNQRLESEMVAGMLTAIRSFVNECIIQSGEISELNEIEYGDSKIILEVAGYCYLAVVVKGDPSKKYIEKIRKTLSIIILDYGQPIEFFNGDPATIPEPVPALLETLMNSAAEKLPAKQPRALLGIGLLALSLILVPWGISFYRNKIERSIEAKAGSALASAPQLAVYRLSVDAEGKTLKLTGKLPNQELREKAGQIAKAAVPTLRLDNQIIAVDVPPDPVLVVAEVKRATDVLNQMEGISISTKYAERKVTVEGTVREKTDTQKIVQALKQIPGVQSVISTIQLNPLQITSRIYFEPGSAALNPAYLKTIIQIKSFLQQYPQKNLRIIGHSDTLGNQTKNQQLARQRAIAVRDALVSQGVDPKRLQAIGKPKPPAGVESNQPLLLSRCVVFEPATPTEINSQ
ncbi:OmpA family protein [Microcoleus sp. FACHB-672]|uniref:OmpA family protein n=1 Tax=Microcoleus sp. FACHB-672 TaxID=2692825 RepID=UPI0016883785|nr:OmpA family protein [Microcoleus sp. FACHB-672]MBD2040004.1 OmpA family protein [Microcoleus sp. FACHB-672]